MSHKKHSTRHGWWIGVLEGKHWEAVVQLGFFKLRESAEAKAKEVFRPGQRAWRVLSGDVSWEVPE